MEDQPTVENSTQEPIEESTTDTKELVIEPSENPNESAEEPPQSKEEETPMDFTVIDTVGSRDESSTDLTKKQEEKTPTDIDQPSNNVNDDIKDSPREEEMEQNEESMEDSNNTCICTNEFKYVYMSYCGAYSKWAVMNYYY